MNKLLLAVFILVISCSENALSPSEQYGAIGEVDQLAVICTGAFLYCNTMKWVKDYE